GFDMFVSSFLWTCPVTNGDGIPSSVRRDPRRLDDRPPFVDLGLLEGGQRLRRKLLARENILREIDQLLPDRWIGQRARGGTIELGDDVLRRALGRPQRVPEREVEAGQSGLV